MKELVEKVAALYADFSKDANAQIENGNKAAGTRARKASLEIEKAMKEFRKASIIYLLLFSEIRNSDECAIFKVALKNSCSKNNEPEKKLHK